MIYHLWLKFDESEKQQDDPALFSFDQTRERLNLYSQMKESGDHMVMTRRTKTRRAAGEQEPFLGGLGRQG